MPFVAIEKSSQKRINILSFTDDPRLTYAPGDIACPLCGADFTIVHGQIRIPHFRHLVTCSSQMLRHPESIHHLMGKQYVFDLLGRLYSLSSIDLEVPLHDIGRQADVMMSMPNGWKEAHEIQLSSITTDELRQRTVSYREAGIHVVWWLGEKAATPANKNWCCDTFGDVRIIEFARDDGYRQHSR